jgi:hypothetical protein
MAHKQSKQALKRRSEKRHRRALTKKATARHASGHLFPFGLDEDSPFLPTQPKLSAVIWDFAEPLTDAASGTEGQKRAAEIAIVSWNAALLPPDKARETLAIAVSDIAGGDLKLESELHQVLDMMVARKRQYFADDHRFVFHFTLTDTDGGLHLMVASSPLSPEKAHAAFGTAPEPLPQLTSHQGN